jgi:polysaccharide biosynthesis protein PslH
MITNEIPFPPVGGGRLRAYQLVEAFAARHDLTVVGFVFDKTPIRSSLPIHVIGVPWQSPQLYKEMNSADVTISRRAYEILAYETDKPWAVSYFESAVMAETLRRVTSGTVDLIVIRDSTMGQYLPDLPTNVPKVLDFTDVLTRIAQRAVEEAPTDEKDRAIREASRMLNFEKAVASQCVLSLVCSNQEAAAARRLLGIERVAVVPNDVDTSFFIPVEEQTISGYLLFTGTMSYAPNIQAAQHFTAHILPLILEKTGKSELHIVGKDPPEVVIGLASEHVTVHRDVPDMRPYYRNAAVVVVPLLQGGGTRRKILEAAASGKAIVTTSLGVEGLDFAPGKDVEVADDATDFANAVIKLTDDEAARRELGKRAREAALRYDRKRIGSLLCEVVESFSNRA